jgi:PAS domain S-box-containing protein
MFISIHVELRNCGLSRDGSVKKFTFELPRLAPAGIWFIACFLAGRTMHSDPPIRVLIVDDDPLDRHLCRHCLQQSPVWEFEFAEATSAAAGIELANVWRPDCTLLDVNLPDMNGIEVLSLLGREPDGLPCATVILTAYGGEELAVRAMRAGASDYLPKGRLSAGSLPHAVVNAVQRFRMQRQIEQQRSALAASEGRYKILLEAIPQMVWSADTEGRVEYANRLWLEYTGLALQKAESEAAHLGWDRLLHPQDRRRTWIAWKKARESGSAFEIEHRLRRASDGSYRWHLVRAVPLRAGTGEIAHWLGTCTEIEEHKQAGNALLEEQKFKGIGRLAGGVAHDFNNLLVCILGGATRAMQSLPPAHPAQEMLRDVVHAGDRLAELTRRMLAYAGKTMFRVEPAQIDRIVNEACESIRTSIPETIRLEIRSGPELPQVRTDPEHMRQAIVDLVWNAVEAIGESSSGRISIRAEVAEAGRESVRTSGFRPAAASGKYVALEVRDTGCGMDEETQNKIFDPFFSTKFMGRGLGLAAVHGFIRSTGGGVEVDSQPGRGSAFRILLPVVTGEGLSNNARA